MAATLSTSPATFGWLLVSGSNNRLWRSVQHTVGLFLESRVNLYWGYLLVCRPLLRGLATTPPTAMKCLSIVGLIHRRPTHNKSWAYTKQLKEVSLGNRAYWLRKEVGSQANLSSAWSTLESHQLGSLLWRLSPLAELSRVRPNVGSD